MWLIHIINIPYPQVADMTYEERQRQMAYSPAFMNVYNSMRSCQTVPSRLLFLPPNSARL
jgi:hypothetical protein